MNFNADFVVNDNVVADDPDYGRYSLWRKYQTLSSITERYETFGSTKSVFDYIAFDHRPNTTVQEMAVYQAIGNRTTVMYFLNMKARGELNSIRNPIYKNDTLLHQAARAGHMDFVTSLLVLGADASSLNDDGLKPIDVMCTRVPIRKLEFDNSALFDYVKDPNADPSVLASVSTFKTFSGNNMDDYEESPEYGPEKKHELENRFSNTLTQAYGTDNKLIITDFYCCQHTEYSAIYANMKAIFEAASAVSSWRI